MRTIKLKPNDKEYVFRTTVLDGRVIGSNGQYKKREIASGKLPWRKIGILGDQNLYKLAEAIIDSFGFDFDHCFGFFGSTKNFYKLIVKSEKNYELFADLEDEGIEPVESGSVKKTKIKKAWEKSGDAMIFMFDYGDDWRFWVELEEIREADRDKKYPTVKEIHGKAPEQY